MSSRWKKVWADFWGNKTRTFLTVITIAVGTFAVGFTNNLGLYMIEGMDSDFLSANPSEATVYAYPMDDDMVKIARTVPGVDAVEGLSRVQARIVRDDGTFIDIQFKALEDPNELTVNLLKPATPNETMLPKYGDKEMILDYSALSLGYKRDDAILIQLGDGKRRELRLTGYVHDVTGVPYNFANRVIGYVTPKTLEWLGESSNYDALFVSVTENPTDQEHVTEVAQAVADRMERAGVTVEYVDVYQPGRHFMWNITQGAFFVLSVLGYLTVILSGFLIVNTVTALMAQQTRQIGIMKSVGGSVLQIFGMYVVLIVGFGACALLIAIPLANAAAREAGAGLAAWMGFWPAPYKGYNAALIQQALVALAAPLLAAILPIYNSMRVTVRETLNNYGLGGNARFKADSVRRNSTLLARPIRISLRNAFRRKARLALTISTLALGGAIFIAVYNQWASFDKTLNNMQGYFLADVNIYFSRFYRLEKIADMAKSVHGVESVEGWLNYPGTLKMNDEETGRQIEFVAPPSTPTAFAPIITAGRWLTPEDENAIIIGNHLLRVYPSLKIGDRLTIEVNGKKTKWRIVGFYSLTANLDVPWLFVNYEYLSRLIGMPEQVYSLRVITASHNIESQRRVDAQLQALYKARGVQVSSTEVGLEWLANQQEQVNVMIYFLLVMAALIAIVGGLGLMGTMSINVLERTREIGVMRAIGASNADIQVIVIVEGMVIGIISWAISVLFSFPITNILAYGVGMAIFNAPMPVVYGIGGIAAWLVFIIALGALASALPARRASRLTIRDTLAYE
ncbi:MAG: ABC transporter permease [Anaerolineales bacterium]|nr:ABC transporter permease [Anaerolineales bacterium]